MALPHLPLTSHTIKKGENLTKIVKKYGHPGQEWKAIYNASYNKAFKAKFRDPNLIPPGEVFLVPSITRKKLEVLIQLLWDLEDYVKRVLGALVSVYIELKKLKKDRSGSDKLYRKAKAKLLDYYKWDRDVRGMADRCWKENSLMGGKLPLGKAAKCATDTLAKGPPKKKMDELKKLYESSAIDHDRIVKKIAEIEKDLLGRQHMIDLLTGTLKMAYEYLGRNYAYFYK